MTEKRTFAAEDGTELCCLHWPAQTQRRGAILFLHGGEICGEQLSKLVADFGLPAFDVFARAATPGDLAPAAGDLQDLADHLCADHALALGDLVVIGQGMAATLAAAWVHDYAPPLRALVLANPALNPSRAPTPLCADLILRVTQDAAAVTVPTQVLRRAETSAEDSAAQQRFFEGLGAMRSEVHALDGFFHDTLGERDRSLAIDKARRFILGCFDVPAARPCLLDADRRGAFKKEADRLARPVPALSLRGLYWRAVRLGLRAGAGLSEGLRIGRETGFDSGSMLDYVYRNRPQGCGPLGRLIDRKYLDAIGWKGIRQRKSNLKALLSAAMERSRRDGLPLHVLDIAAGHGRYVLEAIEAAGARPETVLLRDYSDRNVAEGTALIAQKGLDGIAAFEQGDAFDREKLARVAPRPSVAVVSGLYELFPENHLVRRSLAGLAGALRPGGYLVYTNQPWHPQLEFIARALTSHRQGRAWVMRRRSQAEMDQLVAAAGFEKIAQRIDPWGIFTVSLARKAPLGSLARKAPAGA